MMKDKGYEVRSPVTDDREEGIKLRSPVTKEPADPAASSSRQ
jgi:hypothetical protein